MIGRVDMDDTWVCSYCGAGNKDSRNKCVVCYHDRSNRIKICPACSTENHPSKDYCRKCGAKLSEDTIGTVRKASVTEEGPNIIEGENRERSSLTWVQKIFIGFSSLLGLILTGLVFDDLGDGVFYVLPFGFLLGWGIAYFIIKKRKPTIKQVVIAFVIGIFLPLVPFGLLALLLFLLGANQ